ncbi:MAG: DUF294 nucleotidyltransferase-like domain-containing protein [Pseudomonadota bacterium]
MPLSAELTRFLASVHPYDSLSERELSAVAARCATTEHHAGSSIFALGDELSRVYVVVSGEVEIKDEADVQISILGPRNSFGERALQRGGTARRSATATSPAALIELPSDAFFELIETSPAAARFFQRRRPTRSDRKDVTTLPVEKLMSRDPVSCPPDTTIREAAERMHDAKISSICVTDADSFKGIVTARDMTGRVVADGRDPAAPISSIMTADPMTLGPAALGMDVLHMMAERGIGHVPIVDGKRLVGIVTQTDLTRAQSITSADIVRRIATAPDPTTMARAVAEIPKFLAQLVGAGNRHEVVTRLISDIADAATRRLLKLAEAELGAPPVPYLWLACGSQGRQEQTGVSDQDNCLILSDDVEDAHLPYFASLASFVCDGLNTCGYVYCPGDMMATNPRWRQPLRVWRDYFSGWIAKPDPEAQMLASVMFDLRAIGGEFRLFDDLRTDTLEKASRNSIFTAHMISNSLKHHPPLGLLRGLATIRSGEHRNQIDLKHNGIAPIVDLGRVYALRGRLEPVNTRARIDAARGAGILSTSGGADLLDAYDLIATMRLEHQARQINAGKAPDNYLDPSNLSDFERSHLRDGFVVVRTMQSAIGSGKAALG